MKRIIPILICILILFGITTWVATAAPNALSLTAWTVDSGGGESSGGQFGLYSAIGQPEAGSMSGGPYTLTGGILGQASPGSGQIFLPVLVKQ
jgi:hypothetical protein